MVGSDPVRVDADERMYLLLKSRVRFPDLEVQPLRGWFEVEEDSGRWTAKQFSLEVTLPKETPLSEFA